ncbi:MAG: intradiol ring-cleavage dioxygenase [Burkholderiaceae bacterium]|nr:intradiol ring-cleavage dioxygenase [Burkholderiaceae bacterium]
MSRSSTRRVAIAGLTAVAAALALPALASSRRALARMTDGPFYPPRKWREAWPDQDADLSRVQRGERVLTAQGEHLGLEGSVVDTQGRAIDGAEVEIWQCDAFAHYRHPNTEPTNDRVDEGFQGFGATRSAAAGAYRFRTIKPVPYPGRTPHIHVKIRHASFGELTTQLFIAGDPGNARDGLWRWLSRDDRAALEMALLAAPGDSGLRWLVRHDLVVPA